MLSGPVWEHLAFQFGPNAQVRNPGSYNQHLNYRKAVAHAIDKDKIVDEILTGQVEPMSSYIDAFSPTLAHGNWDQYNYDPAKSAASTSPPSAQRKAWTARPMPPKVVFSTTSNNAARVLLSELFIEHVRRCGHRVRGPARGLLAVLRRDPRLRQLRPGRVGVGPAPPASPALISIHDLFDPEAAPPDGQNYYRWGTPEVTGKDPAGYDMGAGLQDENTARYAELRDLANSTVDEAALTGYMAEMEAILADQVVIIPLYQRLDPGAVWADTIGGYKHNVGGGYDTWNCELWYRLDLG